MASVVLVAYYSLSTESASGYQEITRINTTRLYFFIASSAVSAVVPIYLVDQLHKGVLSIQTFSLLMIFGFGVVYSIPLVLCGIFCHERVPVPREKSVFRYRNFLLPFQVKAFRYLLVLYLCAFTCLDIISVSVVCFAKYSLKLSLPSFVMLGSIMVSYIAMMPVLSRMMRNGRSKPSLIRMGIPLYIASTVILSLLPQDAPSGIVILLCLLIGIGMSGCQVMPWIHFPDVVDVAE